MRDSFDCLLQRCPASQLFITEQLQDAAQHAKELQLAKVAIHPVPYGNTKERLTETGHYQYECQVGFDLFTRLGFREQLTF